MDGDQIATIVQTFGLWTIGFIWAIYERRKNSACHAARIKELKQYINFVAKSEVFQTTIESEVEDDG